MWFVVFMPDFRDSTGIVRVISLGREADRGFVRGQGDVEGEVPSLSRR
jgi:hypothetical protein